MKRTNPKQWGLALLLCGAAGGAAHAQKFSPSNIVVRVIGDGTAALSNAATKNSLQEYTPAGVATGQVFALPTASTAAIPALTVSGTATSEGAVTLSGDGNFLLVTGYDAAPGLAGVASTAVATTNRVLGVFDWQNGTLSEVRITDAYDKNNIRSAASNDGKQFWLSGAASGVRYLASTSATATVGIAASPTTVRTINIFNGQLYATSVTSAGNYYGVFTVGTGLPTTGGQTSTQLPGFPTATGPSPYDFYVNPAGDTVYVTDDRPKAAGGGLQKWTKGTSGAYSLTYTLNTGIAAGLRGLAFAGKDGSGNNTFYAVGDTALVKITDSGSASAFTMLATAPTNTAFRGVEVLGDGSATTATPPDTSITGGPADGSTIGVNTATFTYTGSDAVTPTASLTYEVRVDGGAFSAPTAATSYTASGLADGIHTFEVAAVNAAGLVDATPAKVTFTVSTVPPVISNLTATNLTNSAATITWTTNTAATSQVEYRVAGATAFVPTTPDAALVTAHSVALSGLTALTAYEYRARSTDALGHEAVSAIQTFKTLDTPPISSFTKIRIAQWNVSLYTSGRVNEFQTAIYGSYQGRSMSPDIFIGEEFQVPASVPNFLAILNTAPGSPGDWAAAPFAAGSETVPDTNTAFFYRTSKVNFQKITLVYNSNGTTSDQPRNDYRYDVTLKDMGPNAPTIAVYATHEKSSTTSSDLARRQIESLHIRNDAAALPSTYYYLLGGDLNVQDSAQQPYQTLINPGAGQFKDPILTPGNWHSNAAFKFVHTQDPAGAGGMDDRHDQILLCPALLDGAGLDYDGSLTIPYSATTWDDPNHSYRSWGNDGTSFNTTLTITGNAMVGPTIAQALVTSALNGGHLPVFLDLKVPTPGATISGVVKLEGYAGTTAPTITFLLRPADASGDVTKTAPIDAAGAFSFSGLPLKNYTLHIKGAKWLASNVAADASAGNVSGLTTILRAGDSNDDNSVDSSDFTALIGAFNSDITVAGSGYDEKADFNGDGSVDSSDFTLLIGEFNVTGDPLP